MRQLARDIRNSIAAAILAVFWLLALGAAAALSAPGSYLLLALVLVTFWALHGWRAWPARWQERRRLPGPRWLLWALVLAMLLTGWRLAVALHTPWPSSDPASDLLWLTLAAVLAAPLIEEFGFRLWLQGQLERWLPALLAILIASALFAAAHDLQRWHLHAVSGMLYGLVLWRSDSIWAAIAMHSGCNGIIALLQWHQPAATQLQSWSAQTPDWLDEATIGLTLALLAAALWTWKSRYLQPERTHHESDLEQHGDRRLR